MQSHKQDMYKLIKDLQLARPNQISVLKIVSGRDGLNKSIVLHSFKNLDEFLDVLTERYATNKSSISYHDAKGDHVEFIFVDPTKMVRQASVGSPGRVNNVASPTSPRRVNNVASPRRVNNVASPRRVNNVASPTSPRRVNNVASPRRVNNVASPKYDRELEELNTMLEGLTSPSIVRTNNIGTKSKNPSREETLSLIEDRINENLSRNGMSNDYQYTKSPMY